VGSFLRWVFVDFSGLDDTSLWGAEWQEIPGYRGHNPITHRISRLKPLSPDKNRYHPIKTAFHPVFPTILRAMMGKTG
jgi:hypothetical protein